MHRNSGVAHAVSGSAQICTMVLLFDFNLDCKVYPEKDNEKKKNCWILHKNLT